MYYEFVMTRHLEKEIGPGRVASIRPPVFPLASIDPSFVWEDIMARMPQEMPGPSLRLMLRLKPLKPPTPENRNPE